MDKCQLYSECSWEGPKLVMAIGIQHKKCGNGYIQILIIKIWKIIKHQEVLSTWNRNWYNDPTPVYTDNPYWSRYENYENDRRDRFYGNYGAELKFTPWLKMTGRMGLDFYKFFIEERMAIGSQATS